MGSKNPKNSSGEFSTAQEAFWAGQFGNEYIGRNNGAIPIARKTARFAKIIARTQNVSSILEIGANIGMNLWALNNLLPECRFSAIEINNTAAGQLAKVPNTRVFNGSVFDFSSADLGKHDLTFTFGVLIHINPKKLGEVYGRLYDCSKKYILISEYYNPTPVEVPYRGHSERLYKRDFAGELLDRYSDLELVDYGFQYHRDYNFPADDSTWFLLRKCGK